MIVSVPTVVSSSKTKRMWPMVFFSIFVPPGGSPVVAQPQHLQRLLFPCNSLLLIIQTLPSKMFLVLAMPCKFYLEFTVNFLLFSIDTFMGSRLCLENNVKPILVNIRPDQRSTKYFTCNFNQNDRLTT